MKPTLTYTLACLFLFLAALEKLSAQAPPADTAFVNSAIANARQSYKSAVGRYAHLYDGLEYYDYRMPYYEGHQFFGTNEFTQGNAHYDGMFYEQVPMVYDVVRDEVVISHGASGVKQKLVKEKVKAFSLQGHLFVRLTEQEVQGTGLQTGFYDMLYSNKLKVISKRRKQPEETASPDGLKGYFSAADKLYIWKGNEFHQIRNKKSIYKVLKDEKKPLQKFYRQHKLKFRKNKEQVAVALVEHYDSLAE